MFDFSDSAPTLNFQLFFILFLTMISLEVEELNLFKYLPGVKLLYLNPKPATPTSKLELNVCVV
jgi:hypothetical protein